MPNKLAEAFVEVGLRDSALRRGMAGVQAYMTGQVSRLQATTSQLSQAFGGTLGAIAGAAGFGLVIKSAADFEQAMKTSTAIMIKATEQQKEQMSSVAKQIALDFGVAPKKAAEAFFFLASAGLDAEQSIAALPQVTAFATAGMFDLSTATDLATDAQSALGLSVKDPEQNLANLTRVTDALVGANTLANASVLQFSQALTTKAGAALKFVNKSVEEGTAVLAAFADQGVKGADAGTALNIVLRDLQTKAIQNKDAFAEMGIGVFDSNGNMRNMADIVGDVETALANMSPEMKKATLLQLGFSDKSVVFLQTLIGTSEKIRGYQKELEKMGGITKTVAEDQLDTFIGQMKKLSAAIQVLAIELGQPALEFFTKMAKRITPVVIEMSKMTEETAKLITKITATTFAFTGLLVVLPKVLFMVKAIASTIALLALNPIGIAITALGAFGLALQSAFNNEEHASRLESAFKRIGNALLDMFGIARKNGESVGTMLTGAWSEFVDMAVTGVENVASAIENWRSMFSSIGASIKAFLEKPIATATDSFNLLKSVVTDVFNSIRSFLSTNMSTFMQWGEFANNIFENLLRVANRVIAGIMDLWNSAFPSMSTTLGGVAQFFVDMITKVLDMWSFLTTDIRKTWALAMTFVKEGVILAVLGVLNEVQKLKAAFAAQAAVIDSLWASAMKALSENMTPPMRVAGTVAVGITKAFTSAATAIQSAFKAVGSFMLKVGNGINKVITKIGSTIIDLNKTVAKEMGVDKAANKHVNAIQKQVESDLAKIGKDMKSKANPFKDAIVDAGKAGAEAFNKAMQDREGDPVSRAIGALEKAREGVRGERQKIVDAIEKERDENMQAAKDRREQIKADIEEQVKGQQKVNEEKKKGSDKQAEDAQKQNNDMMNQFGEAASKAAGKISMIGVTDLAKRIQESITPGGREARERQNAKNTEKIRVSNDQIVTELKNLNNKTDGPARFGSGAAGVGNV